MIVKAIDEILEHRQALNLAEQMVEIAREIAALTMTITSRALFGASLGKEAHTMGETINEVANLLEKPEHPGVVAYRTTKGKNTSSCLTGRTTSVTGIVTDSCRAFGANMPFTAARAV
jgi:hypothetical protein